MPAGPDSSEVGAQPPVKPCVEQGDREAHLTQPGRLRSVLHEALDPVVGIPIRARP